MQLTPRLKLALLLSIPLLAGCGGGGAAGLASLFGALGPFFGAAGTGLLAATGGIGDLALAGGAQTGATIAKITNPEPASILLFGSGITGMIFAKFRRQASK